MGGYAWVTLATNDSYSLGALVLAHSLKRVGTKQQLVVLVTPGVTSAMKQKLESVFDIVQEVNILDSKDETNLKLLKRPELGVTFTKLHCWRLTQFDKCVFLDADTMVLQNCDELFDREELSAAPDVGWPDCFNSGVFVYKPSNDTYEKLVQFALEKGSFDGGDQGLLNLYFSDWATKDISKHLPFIYNLCSTACYSYLPAFKQFGADAKIIHFIGSSKPWLQYFNTETRKVQPTGDVKHLDVVLQRWWDIFCTLIHSNLTSDMARSSSDVTHTNLSHHTPEPYMLKPEIWDPWEEFDQTQQVEVLISPNVPSSLPLDAPEPQMQPIESHNTNACTASHQDILPSFEIKNTPQNPVETTEDCYQTEKYSPELTDDCCRTEPVVSFESSESESLHVDCPCLDSVNITLDPKPSDPAPALVVLPSECEAPASVCNETILHTPPPEEQLSNGGLAGAFAQLTLGAPRTAEQSALDDHLRRQGWEVGNIDYLGRDSFDNIWSKICQTLQTASEKAEIPKAKEPTPPPSEVKSSETPAVEASVVAPEEAPKSAPESPKLEPVKPTDPVPESPQWPIKPQEPCQAEQPQCALSPKTPEGTQPVAIEQTVEAPVSPKSAPEGSQLKTPASPQPSVPVPEPTSPQPSVPSPQPAIPSSPQPPAPASPQPATPASPQPETPASPQPATPASPQPETPASPQAATPASPQPGTPASPQPATPAGPQPAAPASPQAATPTSPQQAAPISPQPTTPTSPQSKTTASPQPAASVPKPAAFSPQSSAPSPQPTTLSSPQPTTVAQPAIPASPKPAAPTSKPASASPPKTASASPKSTPPTSPPQTASASPKSTPPTSPQPVVPASAQPTIPTPAVELVKQVQTPQTPEPSETKQESGQAEGATSPTPPPRKGSGGAKKATKSKK